MKRQISTCIAAVAVAVVWARGTSGSEPPAPGGIAPPPLTAPANGSQTEMETLVRGPVHEAFAQPFGQDPTPGAVVPKSPPEPVDEMPPEVMPEGENVEWIPGYWAWDDQRNDFVWVSGLWRAIPPGQRWVPGYWIYYETGYRWRPGYWAPARDGWVWIPARYAWTPRGVIFCDGYWDYWPFHRGVLFSPVYFRHYHIHHHYVPRHVVSIGPLMIHLFVRPRYHHYYFGNFYDVAWARRGIYPWAHAHRHLHRYYDPMRVSLQVRFGSRGHERPIDRIVGWHEYYRAHADHRPARTLAAQHLRTAHPATGPSGAITRQSVLTSSLDQVRRSPRSAAKFRSLPEPHRREVASAARRMKELQRTRGRIESGPAGGHGKIHGSGNGHGIDRHARGPDKSPLVLPKADRATSASPTHRGSHHRVAPPGPRPHVAGTKSPPSGVQRWSAASQPHSGSARTSPGSIQRRSSVFQTPSRSVNPPSRSVKPPSRSSKPPSLSTTPSRRPIGERVDVRRPTPRSINDMIRSMRLPSTPTMSPSSSSSPLARHTRPPSIRTSPPPATRSSPPAIRTRPPPTRSSLPSARSIRSTVRSSPPPSTRRSPPSTRSRPSSTRSRSGKR